MLVLTVSIILILSILTNIVLGRLLYIQFKKIKLYETWIVEYDEWVGSVRNLVQSTYLKMKEIDDKDIFFKDDEVGGIFTSLLNLLKILNDRIQK